MGESSRPVNKRKSLMMLGVALFVVLVHLPGYSAQGQNLGPNIGENPGQYKVIYKKIPDNRGTVFVIGFMQQYKKSSDGAIRLFITSDYNTRAVVEIPDVYYQSIIDVKARQLHSVDVSNALRMDGTKIERKGIRITADAEIVVYGLNIKRFTTDAFLALPVDIQSTKYIIPSFTPSQNSLIGIIAIYDKTTIFVTFRFVKKNSYFTFKGKRYHHKDTLSVTFSRSLDTLQIAHSSDMTGTRIFSDKPISVFSGNECANVPLEHGFCDHLVEHIPPTNTWGRRFITVPLQGRTKGDYFRILASNDSTMVRVNGRHVETLSEGKFVEFDLRSDQYTFIETSKPCLVLQFSKGSKVDSTNTDPFMVMIPPIEQYTAQYTVSTPDQSEKYFDSYINIVIETQHIDGLRLDGRSLRDEKWVPVWGTNHSASRLEVSHGVHRVMHDSPIVPFAIFLYGFSRADSYGYPGGLRLADLTLECVPGKPGDGLDNDCDQRIDEEIQNFIDDDNDGRVDEDLVSEPPRILLEAQTKALSGCPADVKKALKEPKVIAAPLCTSRGPFKLTFGDKIVERECVQHIARTWYVRDGCGNLANTTQDIRIRRPDIQVTFPPDVRGKCNVATDTAITGKPKVLGGCWGDVFSIKYIDMPSLQDCMLRGRTVEREWSVKASCGSNVKRIQRLFPDVTPPKVTFVGKLQYQVKHDFMINWNASEESTFECVLDSPNNPIPCGKGLHGSWSKRGIPDGKHVFWVRATDLLGNVGAYIKHPFNVDKSAPRLEFKRPLETLSQGNIIIPWRSTEVSRFKCGLNRARMEQCGSGTAGRSYLRNLRDGVHSFYVGARDQLGNEAKIIKHTFKIDSTPPRIKFAKSIPPNINSKVDLLILSNEVANFSCALDDTSNYQPCGEGVRANFVAKNLAEGPHILYVKAVDPAGNVADPIFLSWNSDKTSPNILFTPGLPTKFKGTPRITWSSTEWATFECSMDDRHVLSPCGEGVEAQWVKETIPHGSHSLYVRGTDEHGNVGPLANFRFLIDNRSPVVRLNTPLAMTSTSKTMTFRWTSDEMAYYKCGVDNPANLVPCGSGKNGEWTTPSLADGNHVFFLTAKDEVGNKAPTLQHRWNIDNVAPSLRFIGKLPNRTNSKNQRFNWLSTESASFKCSMDSPTVFTSCSSGTSGRWLFRDLDDGSHTFRVIAVDGHGNQGPVLEHTWEIDTKSPSVSLGDVSKLHNKPKVKFNWDSTEPSKFMCFVDDDTTGEPCGSGTDGEYLTPTLVDGEHEFRLLVEDMVGNMAPLIRSKFETDTTGPVVTFDRNDPTKPEKRFSVTWKSSEEGEFECALDDPTEFEKCGSGTKGIFERDDLPDGQHRLYVRGRDKLDNVGQTKRFTLSTDKTSPTLKFTDKANPLSKKTSELFTWSSDEPARFECQIDQRDETDCGQGSNGQLITPSLPDGEHVFQVTPIDEVGNRGKTLDRKWKIDSTAPVLHYTSQPPDVSSNNVTFRWSSLEDATFECALDDVANLAPCGSGTTGEKELRELPKGRRMFWVRGTDDAGNVGSYLPHLWTVDTNPPQIQFTGELPSSSRKSLTLNWKSDEQSEFECALDHPTNFEPCGRGTRGQWTFNDLSEGQRTFYVRAKDELNNVGKPIVHSWLVDSIPPLAIIAPVRPITNNPRMTLSWTANERSKFYCAIGEVGNVIECGQGTSGSWTTPFLRRGPQMFWLIAEDFNGNKGEPVLVEWTVDSDAPTVTFSPESTKKSTTSRPKFVWTSDEEASFQCKIELVTQYENCGDGTSGIWTGSNVPDGKHNFLVRARDKFGNEKQPFRFPFEIDTTPPTGFSITGPPRRTNKPEATFKWRTSENAKFECFLDDQTDPVDCGVGTSGVHTTQPLPDGVHRFQVVATDDLGNKAPVLKKTWDIDTVGPSITFPSDSPKTTLNSPRFTWISSEPASFECSLDNTINWQQCSSGKTGAWQGVNIPDGRHDLYVRGRDDLGNVGPINSHRFNVDNQAPSLKITKRPDRTSSRPRIKWSSNEDVTFECSLDDAEFTACGQGRNGTWSGNNVNDGRHKFAVKGKDTNGNTGLHAYTWTIDSNAPSVTLTGDLPTNRNNPVALFSWKSDEQARFSCAVNDRTKEVNCGYGTYGQYVTPLLPDGEHTFYITPEDLYGNKGSMVQHTWRTDSTPPQVRVNPESSVYNTLNPSFTWTSSEDATFECAVDDTRLYKDCGEGTSGKFTASNVPSGRHMFYIRGKDNANNYGPHVQYPFRVDTLAPQVSLTRSVPRKTKNPKVTFGWTSSEDSVFECTLDSKLIDCGRGLSGSYTTPKLPDGKHTFSLNTVDTVGNKGIPVLVNWETDSSGPEIQFPANLPTKTERNPQVTWTSSEPSNFECALDDLNSKIRCGGGTYGQWSGVNIPKGPHTFWVRGTDDVNNVGEWKRYSFNVDSEGPKITFPEDQPKTTKQNPTFTWSSSEHARFTCGIDNSFSLVDCGRGTNGQWTGSDVSDGRHMFLVYGVDDTNNRGPNAQHVFIVDTSSPVIIFPHLPDTTSSSPRIRWMSTEEASFECALDETDYKPCGNGRNGEWTEKDIPHGQHVFAVRGRDKNGNVGESTKHTWNVDTNPPKVVIQEPFSPTTSNPVRRIQWTSDENARFTCAVDDAKNAVACGYGKQGRWVTPRVTDGRHTFFLIAQDSFGNKAPTVSRTWSVDTSAPKLNVNGESEYNIPNPSFTWTSSEDATFECAVDDTRLYRDCGEGTSGKFTASNVPSGTHMFFVRGKDNANNYGPHVRYPFRVDTRAPQVFLSRSVRPKTKNPKAIFGWSSSEDAKYVCKLDGVAVECGSGFRGSYTTPKLPDGEHTFSLNSVDNVGNKGTPVVVNWETDSSPPEIQFPANLPKITERNPRVTWTSSEPSNFECALDDLNNRIRCGGGTSGQWTGGNTPKGPHTFWTRGTDVLGNVGEWKAYTFEVDSEGPIITFPEDIPKTTKQNPTFTWSSSEPAKFKCGIDSSFNLVDCGQGTNGQWTGSEVEDGRHVFLVYGVDDMKNRGKFAQHPFHVDNKSPVIIFAPLPDKSNGSPRITWRSTEDASFQCSLDGGAYENCGSGVSGVWTGDDLPHGKHELFVKGNDKYGNVGEPKKHTWNVDINAPRVTINEPFPTKTSDPVSTIKWTSDEHANFKCAVDNPNTLVPCGSGKEGRWVTPRVPDGEHTFFLTSQDALGNSGPTLSRRWFVDSTPPQVRVNPDKSVYNTRNPSFTWTSSEDATFECAVDDTRLYRDCGEGTSGKFTANNVPNGKHMFYIRAKDNVNNYGTHVQYPFAVDTQAPRIYLTESVPRQTNNPKAKFAWTSSEDANYECKLDNVVVECGRGSRGKYTTPKLPDGRHTFTLNTVDNVGNRGTPEVVNWEIDSNPPEIQFPANLPRKTKGSPQITWIGSEPSNFECAMDDVSNIVKCGGGTSGQWNGINVPDGSRTFWVRGIDEMKNIGEWKSHKFDVDTEGPKITFPEDQPKTTKQNPTFTWSSSEPARFKCGIDESVNLVDCGEGTNGRWTGVDLPDGRHTFIVYGVDDMNNRGSYAQHVFNVDNSAPVITFSDASEKTSSSPRFSWTSSEDADFECALDDGNYKNCGRGRNAVWTGKDIPHGQHVFAVRGRDRNGNVGEPTKHTWNVDTNAPKVTIKEPFPDKTSVPVITIRWSSDEDAKFYCAIDDVTRAVPCGYGREGQWVTPRMPDGEHTFYLIPEDTLGNRGPPVSRKWSIDSTYPTLTFSAGLPRTSGKNPMLTWTSSEDAEFTCILDDFSTSFDCGSGVSGSWTGQNLTDGRHLLWVRAKDDTGNKGPFISHSWIVDESAPRLRFIGILPTVARKLPVFRWISNELATFECSLDAQTFHRCGKGISGSWSRDEITFGRHVFRVRGRDDQGNVGEPISHVMVVDTTPPEIKLLDPLPTKSKQATATFTWKSDENARFTCAVDSLKNRVECGQGKSGQFTTRSLVDGNHVFYLLGEDSLGNAARIITHRWTVDKTKPQVEFLPNQPKISDSEITLHWRTITNTPSSFECSLDNPRIMRNCGVGKKGSWTSRNIPDGDHTLYIRGKDSFGNVGNTKTHTWRVDTKVPIVKLVGKPPKRSTYNTGSFIWTSDETADYECAVDVVETGQACGRGKSNNWVTPLLREGKHTFYLFATDINGNNAEPIQYTWDIDSKPPRVTMDANLPPVTGRNVTLRWNSHENAKFKCAVDNIFQDRDCGYGKDGKLKLNDLPDGYHTVWIKAVDTLGNSAPWVKHSWLVDSRPPELKFISELPTKTNGSTTFLWRTGEESKFQCGLDTNRLFDCGEGLDSRWTTPDLPDGVHRFFVKATDKFGNTGDTIEHSWIIDTKPPMLKFTRKRPRVSGKRTKFAWVSDEWARFFCAHENINDMQPCGSGMRGRWIEEDLPEGKHRFWVIGIDEVGNKADPLDHEWLVDTKGPTIFFNEPVPKKSGSSVKFAWRSNEKASFFCAFDNPENYFPCGQGFEADIRSDNLRRNGDHRIFIKGIDEHGNEGQPISTTWMVDLVAPVLIDVDLPRLVNRNPVITWKVNEVAVFECALDDLNKFEWCGNGTDGEYRGHDLDKGKHQLIVRVKDPQGNSKPIINHTFVVGIPDNRGREFILGFMQQYNKKRAGSVSLFITSDNETVATITIPGLNFRRVIHLREDELVRVELPLRSRMSGTKKERKGILVSADHEMVVYGLNIMPHSTDAYLALPTDIQGMEYFAVSYTVSRNSLIGIVGIEDSTVVYLTIKMRKDIPFKYDGAVYRDGDTLIVQLRRLETFQLSHETDLTGTRITSTKVISVYSGNECANVPKDKGYCDHLVEMLTPTSTWGRRFITAPLKSRKRGDFFRVVASQDNTVVMFHPANRYTIHAGGYVERDVASDEYQFITASKPCILMQYSKGADADNTDTDPFMIMIPPIEQYGSHYILSTPDRERQQYFQSYINVIILTKHIGGLHVDGKPAYINNVFKKIEGTPYSAAAINVTKGAHRVDHTSPIVTFGAFMYGYAWRDSYGYPGGLRLADITGECTGVDTPADGMDNDCDRRIDEELKNGIDDDGDGRIDEDLATFPPVIKLSQAVYEYESCTLEVDALVPQAETIGTAECELKGALRLTYRDDIHEAACTRLINRTWIAADGCGNIVTLTQVIKITKPKLLITYPVHVPNGCNGPIDLSVTGGPEVGSICELERVRVSYTDNISIKECQEKGLLLVRRFKINEICGREYTGVQRIYPGAVN